MKPTVLLKTLSQTIFLFIAIFMLTLLKITTPIINQKLYYISLFIILVLNLLIGRIRNISLIGLAFVAATGISLIFNNAPAYFNAESRWIAWVLIFVIFGPFINNRSFKYFRNNAFQTILFICSIIGIASFLWYIFALPNLGRGIFTGVTYHSMMLGPLCAIGALSVLDKILYKKNSYKIFNYTILATSLISMLLSSSRTALIAFTLSSLLALYFRFRGKTILIIGALALTGMVLLTNSSQFDELTSGIQEKGNKNSREMLWSSRIQEFKSSPLYGIGFSTAAINTSKYNDEGTIEPGSSWLAILSMTGLIGFFAFLWTWVPPYYKSFKSILKKTTSISPQPTIIITFFLISFFTEGYIFASGSPLAMIFWLSIGVLWDNLKRPVKNYKRVASINKHHFNVLSPLR